MIRASVVYSYRPPVRYMTLERGPGWFTLRIGPVALKVWRSTPYDYDIDDLYGKGVPRPLSELRASYVRLLGEPPLEKASKALSSEPSA